MVRLMKQSHSLFAAYIKPLENLTCRGLVLAIFFTCKRFFFWFPFFFSFQITCTTMPVNLIALYFLCPPFNFFCSSKLPSFTIKLVSTWLPLSHSNHLFVCEITQVYYWISRNTAVMANKHRADSLSAQCL